MSNPINKPQRFDFYIDAKEIVCHPDETGFWIHHSDYEKLEKEYNKLKAEVEAYKRNQP